MGLVEKSNNDDNKKKQTGNRVILLITKLLPLLSILLLCLSVVRLDIFNRNEIKKLQSQVNSCRTNLQIMQNEIDTLKVFVDKPLKDYTIEELFTIDEVKEFDATYRQELDDDPSLGDYIVVDEKDIVVNFHFWNKDKNTVLIERSFGIVQDNELNGKLIDCGSLNDYISYRNVKNAQKGDLIITYTMYKDGKNGEVISYREDFVLDYKGD